MSGAELSEKIVSLFEKQGIKISYARITPDNRIGVRCEQKQANLVSAALKGIGYPEVQTIKSFDEVTIVGSRA